MRLIVGVIAAMGYGPSSVWEERKHFGVPHTVRLNARAETIVRFYRRVSRNKLGKLWKRLARRES